MACIGQWLFRIRKPCFWPFGTYHRNLPPIHDPPPDSSSPEPGSSNIGGPGNAHLNEFDTELNIFHFSMVLCCVFLIAQRDQRSAVFVNKSQPRSGWMIWQRRFLSLAFATQFKWQSSLIIGTPPISWGSLICAHAGVCVFIGPFCGNPLSQIISPIKLCTPKLLCGGEPKFSPNDFAHSFTRNNKIW